MNSKCIVDLDPKVTFGQMVLVDLATGKSRQVEEVTTHLPPGKTTAVRIESPFVKLARSLRPPKAKKPRPIRYIRY